jgi:hypothetical protein
MGVTDKELKDFGLSMLREKDKGNLMVTVSTADVFDICAELVGSRQLLKMYTNKPLREKRNVAH